MRKIQVSADYTKDEVVIEMGSASIVQQFAFDAVR